MSIGFLKLSIGMFFQEIFVTEGEILLSTSSQKLETWKKPCMSQIELQLRAASLPMSDFLSQGIES